MSLRKNSCGVDTGGANNSQINCSRESFLSLAGGGSRDDATEKEVGSMVSSEQSLEQLLRSDCSASGGQDVEEEVKLEVTAQGERERCPGILGRCTYPLEWEGGIITAVFFF